MPDDAPETREVEVPLLGILLWYREACLPGWLLSSHELRYGNTVVLHLVREKEST